MTMTKCALVMAGGTGGHIFPGLAVAEALRERAWTVHWLGGPDSMESRLVPARGFAFETVDFSGVRGKGGTTLVLLPLRLLTAFWQSLQVLRRVRPDVVIGLGGYITFPAGLVSALLGKPLLLHEQNSVAGLANKVLAAVARRVFSAFPGVLKQANWAGNPLRPAFLQQPGPEQRLGPRTGPLKLLVVGGSLGARALNDVVPKALALVSREQRPTVLHQSGAKQIEQLRANYAAARIMKRTPGIGFMPIMRRTPTWAWPAPTSTTSFRIGSDDGFILGILASRSRSCRSDRDRPVGEPGRQGGNPQGPAQRPRDKIDRCR